MYNMGTLECNYYDKNVWDTCSNYLKDASSFSVLDLLNLNYLDLSFDIIVTQF